MSLPCEFVNLASSNLIKAIHFSVPNAYNPKFIEFGFEANWKNGLMAILPQVVAREPYTPVMSLDDANALAGRISTHFQTQVSVIEFIRAGVWDPTEQVFQQAPVPMALRLDDATHTRAVLEYLEQEGHISVGDRADLNGWMVEVEKLMNFSARLADHITPAQREALEAVCTPYIDAIFDGYQQIPTQEALLGEAADWCTFDTPTPPRETLLCIYLESFKMPATLFLEQFGGLKECCDSGSDLARIFDGNAFLDSTFTRLDTEGGVPHLAIQRWEIFKMIDQKLTEEWGPEQMPEETSGLSLEGLQRLRFRLEQEGFPLSFVEGKQISIRPWTDVVAGLRGDFSGLKKYNQSEEEASQLFNQIVEEIRTGESAE